MKRSISEISSEQVQDLLMLYCGLGEDGRSTKASVEARRAQIAAELSKRRADLGLSEAEASELSVVLESNRRSHWSTMSTGDGGDGKMISAPRAEQPAGAPI